MIDATETDTADTAGTAAADAETLESPVQALAAECQRMAERLAELGIGVNYGGRINLRDLSPAIDASAAGAVLVAKGICSQEEWQFTTLRLLQSVLAPVLQKAEEEALQAAKPRIAVPTPSHGLQTVRLLSSARRG